MRRLRAPSTTLPARVEDDEFDRHAEASRELAREVDRDAARLAGGRVLDREHRVAELIAARSLPVGASCATTAGGAADDPAGPGGVTQAHSRAVAQSERAMRCTGVLAGGWRERGWTSSQGPGGLASPVAAALHSCVAGAGRESPACRPPTRRTPAVSWWQAGRSSTACSLTTPQHPTDDMAASDPAPAPIARLATHDVAAALARAWRLAGHGAPEALDAFDEAWGRRTRSATAPAAAEAAAAAVCLIDGNYRDFRPFATWASRLADAAAHPHGRDDPAVRLAVLGARALRALHEVDDFEAKGRCAMRCRCCGRRRTDKALCGAAALILWLETARRDRDAAKIEVEADRFACRGLAVVRRALGVGARPARAASRTASTRRRESSGRRATSRTASSCARSPSSRR